VGEASNEINPLQIGRFRSGELWFHAKGLLGIRLYICSHALAVMAGVLSFTDRISCD